MSLSVPTTSSEPVEQLDRAVEIIHQVSRTVSTTVVDREELIALGGLLTQISGALLTLADQLIAPAHHYDRTRALRHHSTAAHQPSTRLLLDCRNNYLSASSAARAFHAQLKR